MTDQEIKKKTVAPGDSIAVIEEALYDKNCYEDKDGIIRSNSLGSMSKKDYKINIEKGKSIIVPSRGKDVICYVLSTKKKVALVNIYYVKERYSKDFIECPVPFSAQIQFRSVPVRYSQSMYDIVRPGEWVLGSVQRDDPLFVSLNGRNSGVLEAYCNFCGSKLVPARYEEMKCTNSDCGKKQGRFYSKFFYGFQKLSFQK